MTKSIMTAAALAFAVVATPANAQDVPRKNTNAQTPDEPSEEEVASAMQSLFTVAPLTAEQRARLPQAEAVIAKMVPSGTMQQMMGGMFDTLLNPMLGMGAEATSSDIAIELAIDDEDFAIAKDDAVRVAAIIDPARAERRKREAEIVQRSMSVAMTAMEPAMRKGMAEAYAVTFTTGELTAIDRFFATPEGAAFARKSYALSSDPRIMGSAMSGLPDMMASMKSMESEIEAATAQLPQRRAYADLTPAERAEMARLTGLDQTAIREGLAQAAAERARKDVD